LGEWFCKGHLETDIVWNNIRTVALILPHLVLQKWIEIFIPTPENVKQNCVIVMFSAVIAIEDDQFVLKCVCIEIYSHK
jgi:hypothetical protein